MSVSFLVLESINLIDNCNLHQNYSVVIGSKVIWLANINGLVMYVIPKAQRFYNHVEPFGLFYSHMKFFLSLNQLMYNYPWHKLVYVWFYLFIYLFILIYFLPCRPDYQVLRVQSHTALLLLNGCLGLIIIWSKLIWIITPVVDRLFFHLMKCHNCKSLNLFFFGGCKDIEEIFDSQTVAEIPNLRQVDLEQLKSLKYIWKSKQGTVLKFPNLTRLSIEWCSSLEYVFTCSMVGSLLQLQELHIRKCSIKVIVKGEEE